MKMLKKMIQNELVRKYCINILVLCIAILTSLFIVEGLLRVVYVRDGLQNHIELYRHSCYAKTRPPNISDRYILKRPDTNVLFETNNLGFRDITHEIEKPEGTYRIIFLGDSMVEGREVEFEERFDQLVQDRLRNQGVNVEVITFAVSSNHAVNYAQTMECIGYEYNPDLVIVNYFPHNDFMDFTHTGARAFKNNFRTPGEIVHQPNHQNAFFIKINNALLHDKKSRLLTFLQDIYDSTKPKHDSRRILPFISIYYGVTTGDYAESVWKSNMRIFEFMFTQANKRGVDMLWVNLAMGELVETTEDSFTIAGQEFEEAVHPYPIQREETLADAFDVHYLYLHESLHADFLKHGTGLYAEGQRGKHYSPRGQAVVAETISDYIMTNIIRTQNSNE